MPLDGVDLVQLLGSSGLAAVNVYLLFKVLTILSTLSSAMATILEHLRHMGD